VSPHAYLIAVTIGAAFLGLWLSVRLARFAPRRGFAAAACLALGWFVPRFGVPLLTAALARLPVGLAILTSIFPVFVLTFALIAFGLRYLASLAGHAVR
jgi:hypothetical protein